MPEGTRLDLVRQARTYLGVPFRHAGRDRQGVDCVGVLICAARDLSLTAWDDRDYSRIVSPERMRGNLLLFADPMPPAARRPGDVLLFRIQGAATHVGLLTEPGAFLHAYQSVGCVCEHALAGKWESRLVEVFRLRGLADGEADGTTEGH